MGEQQAMGATGVAAAEILAELDRRRSGDADWKSGKQLAGVFTPGDEGYRLSVEAYTRFLSHNALYPNLYPSIAAFEREVLRSVANLLRGDENVVGSVTSGGTESILMALKTARDYARATRPQVKSPEVVLPITAHPAFHKAAHYLGLRTRVTPVETRGFRADVEALRRAVGDDTILIVGSAPNYSHGTIDPIPAMAQIARERGILMHVDACVGGLYLPFLRKIGEPVPDFDFAVDGVTSMSADLHKYGYAPKNVSSVLYRNRGLRRHAFFVCSGTTEYAVINPTAQSSRTGGPVAAAWTVLRHLGEDGFCATVRQTIAATRRLVGGINEIPGLRVLGDPDMAMFTVASDELNIFELADEMQLRGWALVPQFACAGGPENLHFGVTPPNVAHVDALLNDLRAAVADLRRRGTAVDLDAIRAAVAEVEGKSIEEVTMRLIPLAGLAPAGLPERMAALNSILNLLKPEVRDELLAIYANSVM